MWGWGWGGGSHLFVLSFKDASAYRDIYEHVWYCTVILVASYMGMQIVRTSKKCGPNVIGSFFIKKSGCHGNQKEAL